MPKRWFILFLAGLLLVCPGFVNAAQNQPLDLAVVHVNDTHSHVEELDESLTLDGKKTFVELGGMARLSAKLADVRCRNQNTLFLHAGDAVQGTAYYNKFRGQIEMDLLNLMRCDAMVLGNHEFDRGPLGTARILGWAAMPTLAGNVDFSKEPLLTGKTRPYIIKEFQGEKVGIIGLVTTTAKNISSPGPTIKFLPEIETAQKYVKELESQGVNKIIVLSHLGFDVDRELAERVKGVDLVVGGHTHTMLGNKACLQRLGKEWESDYPTKVKWTATERVCLVQAWEWAKTVGVLQVKFDGKGLLKEAGGQAVFLVGEDFYRENDAGKKALLDGVDRDRVIKEISESPCVEIVEPDQQVIGALAPFRAVVDKLREDDLVKVAEDLLHIRAPGRTKEGVDLPHGSRIAPLVAQSMLWKAGQLYKAQLAWVNGGGVRTKVAGGELNHAQVYELLPFENTLVVLEMNGRQLRQALDLAVASKGGGEFPYPAGFRYTADMNRAEGERIARLQARDENGDWSDIQEDATYRLVTNSYVAGKIKALDTASGSAPTAEDTIYVDLRVFVDFCRNIHQGGGVLKPLDYEVVEYIPVKQP